jgi:hypothetical protein
MLRKYLDEFKQFSAMRMQIALVALGERYFPMRDLIMSIQ